MEENGVNPLRWAAYGFFIGCLITFFRFDLGSFDWGSVEYYVAFFGKLLGGGCMVGLLGGIAGKVRHHYSKQVDE